jgi:cell division septation protein DedD
MDNRVRDLDQIQELDGDDRGRRLGTILMATAAVVGLTFAVGVVIGRAAEPAPKADDPLAKLDRAATASAQPALAHAQPEAPAPKVEASDLSFPSTLADDEDRPEVIAALKAAEAEEAALAARTVAPVVPPAPPAPAVAAKRPAQDDVDDDADDTDDVAPAQKPVAKLSAEEMVANIPAAEAAGTGARHLRKVVQNDPLVAAAIRSDEEAKVETAPRGHEGKEGEFTLQVISYDRPEPSRGFAEGLRAKGHAAFVVSADIPDRGRYYRVRIGPFKSKEQAEAYRHKFEDEEHMNTFVVREAPEK